MVCEPEPLSHVHDVAHNTAEEEVRLDQQQGPSTSAGSGSANPPPAQPTFAATSVNDSKTQPVPQAPNTNTGSTGSSAVGSQVPA